MTRAIRIRSGEFFRGTIAAASGVIALVLLFGPGCIPHQDCFDVLRVRGRLVDAESGAPVAGAFVGGRALADGVETEYVDPLDQEPSESDGFFVILFPRSFGPCLPADFPGPDQLEIIVIRGGCEHRFVVQRESLESDVFDLIDPILVPPCEQSP